MCSFQVARLYFELHISVKRGGLSKPLVWLLNRVNAVQISKVLKGIYSLMQYKGHNSMRWPFYNHFWPFFCQLHEYLLQNLGADSHFEGLNVSKSQWDQNLWHKTQFFWQVCSSILEEKNWKFKIQKWPFSPISGHFFGTYVSIFHKTEIQTVILRCLVCKNSSWIKRYITMLVKIFFFSCLKMHQFSASLPKWILNLRRKLSSWIFKMVIFSIFSRDTYSGEIQVQKQNLNFLPIFFFESTQSIVFTL